MLTRLITTPLGRPTGGLGRAALKAQTRIGRALAEQATITPITLPTKTPTPRPLIQGPIISTPLALTRPPRAQTTGPTLSAPAVPTRTEAIPLVIMARLRPPKRLKPLALRRGTLPALLILPATAGRPLNVRPRRLRTPTLVLKECTPTALRTLPRKLPRLGRLAIRKIDAQIAPTPARAKTPLRPARRTRPPGPPSTKEPAL